MFKLLMIWAVLLLIWISYAAIALFSLGLLKLSEY